MRLQTIILCLCAVVLITGCGEQQRHLPNAIGGQGEVLVVMHKGHWESAPGAAIRNFLEQPIARLPQREPRFKVAHSTPESFGSLLATHHNVIHAVIGPEADTNAVRRTRDVHARGQLLVRISATEPQAWLDLLHSHGIALMDVFEVHQRERIMARLSKQRDAAMVSSLRAAHQLTMEVPSGYRVIEQDANFSWLQRDRMMSGAGLEHNVIEGLLVYHYPYTSDTTFHVEYLVDMRDRVTERYVKGPVDGSYMIVQRGFDEMDLMPETRITQVDGRFAYLMHGLFGMEGAKMGGPFVSLTTIDEPRGRVVTVEGFVYAPQFDKREYIRELEAVLFSLQIEPGG
jgi:hypothetical protein